MKRIGHPLSDVLSGQSISSREELLAHVESVPSLPTTVVQILALPASSPEMLAKLRELVQFDPSLSSRVLAIANSAFYAPITPVLDINTAVTRLGARIVSEVIRSFAVLRVFVPTTQGHVDLWNHAIQVATLGRSLAEAVGKDCSPDFLYTVGILHDVGRLIMFAAHPGGLAQVDESGWASPAELITSEKRIFELDHAELGACVCAHWGIPEEIVQVIQKHHEVIAPEERSGPRLPMMAILQQADLWSCVLLRNPEAPDEAFAALLKKCILPGCEQALESCDLGAMALDALGASRAQSEALGLHAITSPT